jgi:hypothetical protein
MTIANEPYLPPGLYTLEMSESRRTKGSNANEALRLLRELQPGQLYIYAMALESPAPVSLVSPVRRSAVRAGRSRVPRPGC